MTRAHLARAVVESMAYQVRDAVEAMAEAAGTPVTALRVDGGAVGDGPAAAAPGRPAAACPSAGP